MTPSLNLIPVDPVIAGFIIAWAFFWKALALWHSARNDQLGWYIAMVLLQTLGLLELIYLLFFRRKRSIWSSYRT